MNKKILLAISVLAVLAGCQKKGSAADATGATSIDTAAVPVVVADIRSIPWDDWASYSADLRGVDDAVLVTSAAGVVHSIASVGTRAHAGQDLCDIESDRYKVQMQAAKSAWDAAAAQLDITTKNVEAGSVGKTALQGLAAQTFSAQAQYLGAKKLYDESRCLAPFAGIVASKMVNQWQAVNAGTPMLRMVRLDRLEADFTVPEAESHGMKVGLPVEFTLLDAPDHVYKGKVSSVDLSIDARDRTMGAKVLLSNSDGKLKPGMVGNARVLRKSYSSAVVVPSDALLRQEKGVFAAIVRDGVAHMVQVELGSAQGDSVLVLSGLSAGDHIVVQGAFRVSEGARVKE
jgi:membrane fusion protein (multidrug efflux system)